jgi:hypothetical protein
MKFLIIKRLINSEIIAHEFEEWQKKWQKHIMMEN